MTKQKLVPMRLTILFVMAAMLAVLASSAIAQSLPQSSNPLYNPNQIAILRWYDANTAPITFNAGVSGPIFLAFDGEHMWVSSWYNGAVSELSLNGEVLSVIPLGGQCIGGMAYDGANIWASNYSTNQVQKINVATHSVTTYSYDGLTSPQHVAFDGTSIWVSGFNSKNVLQINPANGNLVKTYAYGWDHPTSMAFDGKCLWVVDGGQPGQTSGSVTVLGVRNCTLDGKNIQTGQNPLGIAYDGTNMWVANTLSNNVVELDGTSGAILQSITVGVEPHGVLFDGAHIWVANHGSNTVTKLMASNSGPAGKFVGVYPLVWDGLKPQIRAGEIAFDGTNLWFSLGGTLVQKF